MPKLLLITELTNGHALMHYSRHRLTALVTTSTLLLRTHKCQPMTIWIALLAHWSVHQKLNVSVPFSSVMSLCTCVLFFLFCVFIAMLFS